MTSAGREQILYSKMEYKRNRIRVPILVLIGMAILVGVIFNLAFGYRPPTHDSRAVAGVPQPDESFMYGSGQGKHDYYFKMAGNLYQQENGDLYVYFTNPSENNVRLRLEIMDQLTGNTLYNTGYIEPGEYIEKLHESISNQYYDVIAKIYGYEENFTSAGTTEVELKLQPW